MSLSINPSVILPGETAIISGGSGSYRLQSYPMRHDPSKQVIGSNQNGAHTFAPDCAGNWTILDGFPPGTTTLTVSVPSVASIAIDPTVKLVVHLQEDLVVEITRKLPGASVATQLSPALSLADPNPTYAAKLAMVDARVIAARDALIGMTSAQVTATGLPALKSAWATAIANPNTPPTENAGAVVLQSAGWSV